MSELVGCSTGRRCCSQTQTPSFCVKVLGARQLPTCNGTSSLIESTLRICSSIRAAIWKSAPGCKDPGSILHLGIAGRICWAEPRIPTAVEIFIQSLTDCFTSCYQYFSLKRNEELKTKRTRHLLKRRLHRLRPFVVHLHAKLVCAL